MSLQSEVLDFSSIKYEDTPIISDVYAQQPRVKSSVYNNKPSLAKTITNNLGTTPSGNLSQQEKDILNTFLNGTSNYKELLKRFFSIYLVNSPISTVDSAMRLGVPVMSTTTKAIGNNDKYAYKFTKSGKLLTKLEAGNQLGLPPFVKDSNLQQNTEVFPEIEVTNSSFDYKNGLYEGEVTIRTDGFLQVNNAVNAMQNSIQHIFGPVFTYLNEWDLSMYIQEGLYSERITDDPDDKLQWDLPSTLDYRMFVDHPYENEDGTPLSDAEVESAYPLTCAVSKLPKKWTLGGNGLNEESFDISSSPLSRGWAATGYEQPHMCERAKNAAGGDLIVDGEYVNTYQGTNMSRWFDYLMQADDSKYIPTDHNIWSHTNYDDYNEIFLLIRKYPQEERTLSATLRFETVEQCALSGYNCTDTEGRITSARPLSTLQFYQTLYHSSENSLDDIETLYSTLDDKKASKNALLTSVISILAENNDEIWKYISECNNKFSLNPSDNSDSSVGDLTALQENISMSTNSESDIKVGFCRIPGSKLLKMFLKRSSYSNQALKSASRYDTKKAQTSVMNDVATDIGSGVSGSEETGSELNNSDVAFEVDSTLNVSTSYPKPKGLLYDSPFIYGGPIGQYDYPSSLAFYTSVLAPTSPIARIPTRYELNNFEKATGKLARLKANIVSNPKNSSAYAFNYSNTLWKSTLNKNSSQRQITYSDSIDRKQPMDLGDVPYKVGQTIGTVRYIDPDRYYSYSDKVIYAVNNISHPFRTTSNCDFWLAKCITDSGMSCKITLDVRHKNGNNYWSEDDSATFVKKHHDGLFIPSVNEDEKLKDVIQVYNITTGNKLPLAPLADKEKWRKAWSNIFGNYNGDFHDYLYYRANDYGKERVGKSFSDVRDNTRFKYDKNGQDEDLKGLKAMRDRLKELKGGDLTNVPQDLIDALEAKIAEIETWPGNEWASNMPDFDSPWPQDTGSWSGWRFQTKIPVGTTQKIVWNSATGQYETQTTTTYQSVPCGVLNSYKMHDDKDLMHTRYYDPYMSEWATKSLIMGITEDYFTIELKDKAGKTQLMTLKATPHATQPVTDSPTQMTVDKKAMSFPTYSYYRRCGCRHGWSRAGSATVEAYAKVTEVNIPYYTFEVVEETSTIVPPLTSGIDMSSDKEPRIECNIYRHMSQEAKENLSKNPNYYAESGFSLNKLDWKLDDRYSLTGHKTYCHDLEKIHMGTISNMRDGYEYTLQSTQKAYGTSVGAADYYWYEKANVLEYYKVDGKTESRYVVKQVRKTGRFLFNYTTHCIVRNWVKTPINLNNFLKSTDKTYLVNFINEKQSKNKFDVTCSLIPVTEQFMKDTFQFYAQHVNKELNAFEQVFCPNNDITVSQMWSYFEKTADAAVVEATKLKGLSTEDKGILTCPQDNIYYDRVLAMFYDKVVSQGEAPSLKTLTSQVKADIANLSERIAAADFDTLPDITEEVYKMTHYVKVEDMNTNTVEGRFNLLYFYMMAFARIYQQYRKFFILKRFNKTDGTYYQLRNIEKVLEYAEDFQKEQDPDPSIAGTDTAVAFFDVQNSDAMKASALSKLEPLEQDYATVVYVKVEYVKAYGPNGKLLTNKQISKLVTEDVETVTNYDGTTSLVKRKYFDGRKVVKVPENGKWAYLPDDGEYYLSSKTIEEGFETAEEKAASTIYKNATTNSIYDGKTYGAIMEELEKSEHTNSKIYAEVSALYEDKLESITKPITFNWYIKWDPVYGASNKQPCIDVVQQARVKLSQLMSAKMNNNTDTTPVRSCITFDLPYGIASPDQLNIFDLTKLDAQELSCLCISRADFWHIVVPKDKTIGNQIKPYAALLDEDVALKPFTSKDPNNNPQGLFTTTVSPVRAISMTDLDSSMETYVKTITAGVQ